MRPSLTCQLRELRRSYTGETDSTLVPAINAAVSSLTAEGRTVVRDTLDAGYESRLLGENSCPPLCEQIRRAVLADATDPAQQQLEAGILFALGRIAPYRWPATTVVAPMPVCTMVRPIDGTQTILHQRVSASAPMIATALPRVAGESVRGLAGLRARIIAALLPRVVDGTVHGLAGLRARPHRRNVILYLADSDASGSVALSGTDHRRWAAMLRFAHVVTGHEWPVSFEGPVTEQERAVIAAGRVPGPAPVASALLRRLRILGDTMWLTVQPDGPAGIRMDWSGGRTAVQVATALVHPLTGLPGDQFIVTRTTDGPITITSSGADGAARARVVLHQAPLTMPPPFTRIDATAAWAQFDRAMSCPNPWPPTPTREAIVDSDRERVGS